MVINTSTEWESVITHSYISNRLTLSCSLADICSFITNHRVEEAELNLHETGQECAQVKELRSQLQADVINLQDELQRKEASLQTALSEKAVIERKLDVARSELERAKQQVNEMSAQLDENAEQLQTIQEQVDGRDRKIESLTQEVCMYLSYLAVNIIYNIHSQWKHCLFIIIMCYSASLLLTHFWAVLFHACVYLNA